MLAKFKPGSLMTHNPTRSQWIILNREIYTPPDWMKSSHQNGYDSARKYRVEAYCLLVGSKPQYWTIGCLDVWFLTNQDMGPSDFVWSVNDIQ